ncbi:fasciclin domain-containing protein [Flavobacterium muglaense]|uniref:Fasciclin domain-containing protein n=1 Tax=Flavobacterium muglaense TaxID=2764716 RepID=A0A923N0E7_9FLAO|nr:fasciclin domain-containing protein [Flavobacterium muglaense]MBC5838189.1 fasciclin domain-containing protein [Flavobacterium muglaense]MBC5844727.1 fasciclin domain-containing protein [Flavobacterium muglaense]
MKNLFKLQNLTIVFTLLVFLTSCNSDDNSMTDNTITGLASKTDNLSILVQALQKAELTTTLQASGSYTVFAPTNDAFTAFLATTPYKTVNEVPKEALKEILLNHVIATKLVATDLKEGYIKTLAKGTASTTNTLSMYVNISNGVKLNGVATVTTPNIMASNGVIHLVDKVIGLPTVVTHATANPNFTSLVGALTKANQPDFVSILSGTGPFTVFAPTNAAFTALNIELAPGGIASVSDANLTKVLQYHVISPANVLAASLTEGQSVTPILTPAQKFTINLTGGAKIKDANNRISSIIITDVQCSNGVIHAIDKVLLPVF